MHGPIMMIHAAAMMMSTPVAKGRNCRKIIPIAAATGTAKVMISARYHFSIMAAQNISPTTIAAKIRPTPVPIPTLAPKDRFCCRGWYGPYGLAPGGAYGPPGGYGLGGYCPGGSAFGA